MSEIVLTEAQASIVSSAQSPIAVLRPDGTLLGWVSPGSFVIPEDCPFSPEEIEAAETKAGAAGPWYTTNEVLGHLRSLDQ
jgi:hypothetical protein